MASRFVVDFTGLDANSMGGWVLLLTLIWVSEVGVVEHRGWPRIFLCGLGIHGLCISFAASRSTDDVSGN